jgi:hypothetical protein
MEPLLAPVDLSIYIGAGAGYRGLFQAAHGEIRHRRPSWIILGGESGARPRDLDLAWIRSLRDQARHAGIAVFVKQFGENAIDPENGVAYHGRPIVADVEGFAKIRRVKLVDSHGGDPSEWPADLRVQEFPREVVV